MPVILLATVYETLNLVLHDETVAWDELALGIAVSALIAYLTIGFFMRVVGRVGLLPFAVYRLLLAALILYVLDW